MEQIVRKMFSNQFGFELLTNKYVLEANLFQSISRLVGMIEKW